jgi:hypothetical protein
MCRRNRLPRRNLAGKGGDHGATYLVGDRDKLPANQHGMVGIMVAKIS